MYMYVLTCCWADIWERSHVCTFRDMTSADMSCSSTVVTCCLARFTVKCIISCMNFGGGSLAPDRHTIQELIYLTTGESVCDI